MSSTMRPAATSSTNAQSAERSYFEQQREVLLKEIGVVRVVQLVMGCGRAANNGMQSFEHVLTNINKLNRSLEGVIAVCPKSSYRNREGMLRRLGR